MPCRKRDGSIPVKRTHLARMAALAAGLSILPGAVRAQQAPAQPAPDSSASWTLHEQATWIDQYHPSFSSPYEGPNSLTGGSQAERTFSSSLFLGYRIWADTEIYFNPELLQGHGLSNTTGVA